MSKKIISVSLLFVAAAFVILLTGCQLTTVPQPVAKNTITVDEVNKLLNELQETGDINLGGRTSSMWNQNGVYIYNDNNGPVIVATNTTAYSPDLATGIGDLFITDNLETYGNASGYGDWQSGEIASSFILLYSDVKESAFSIGTTTPNLNNLFSVSAPAGNATTYLRFGDDGSSNTKGTCIEMTTNAGAIYHLWLDDNGTLTSTVGACI